MNIDERLAEYQLEKLSETLSELTSDAAYSWPQGPSKLICLLRERACDKRYTQRENQGEKQEQKWNEKKEEENWSAKERDRDRGGG